MEVDSSENYKIGENPIFKCKIKGQPGKYTERHSIENKPFVGCVWIAVKQDKRVISEVPVT
jgi:hypothetical protein